MNDPELERYRITIDVSYEADTTPENMLEQLAGNVQRCVQNHDLLNDANWEADVWEWDALLADDEELSNEAEPAVLIRELQERLGRAERMRTEVMNWLRADYKADGATAEDVLGQIEEVVSDAI